MMYKLFRSSCSYKQLPKEVVCPDSKALIHFAYDYIIEEDSEDYKKSMRLQMSQGFGGKFLGFIIMKVEEHYFISKHEDYSGYVITKD